MDATRILAQGVFVFLVITYVGAEREPRTILVGDSQGWQAGTNYTQWAIQNSPFHINDTLGKLMMAVRCARKFNWFCLASIRVAKGKS